MTVFLAELEDLLLSLKQVRSCLSDQQSQNDIELVVALLNKVIRRELEWKELGVDAIMLYLLAFAVERI